MYRIGPHPELLGRIVGVPRGAAADRDDVSLEDPEQFTDVRTRSLFVPTLIEGDVDADAGPRGQALAIAVDGRIAATTATYADGGHNHFTALVPEGAFPHGANSVDVYRLRGGAGGVRLSRLGGTPRGRPAMQRVRQEARSKSTTEQDVTAG